MAHKNPEDRIAYDKAYYKANSEKIKRYQKAYREANPEKVQESQQAWRKRNREKAIINWEAWRKAHPDYKADPQKQREQSQKRRALKRTTKVEPISEKQVFTRDRGICQHCKKKVDKRFKYPNPMSASLDHIIPLTQGGSHTYANIQLTHLICNLIKKVNVLPQGEQLRMF